MRGKTMIICEGELGQEDRKNPGYSMAEVDYYDWIPAESDIRNHRLTLRKNLVKGEYEFPKGYNKPAARA